ncbi:uncharacterized protein LOC132269729 [Cornus florida]|uniref:uncharacterized protein LOC132269729 n=1 Tax=Cornus florida TaxID=4283 RepID=UPI00289821C1|nr:uncharacterized protein LOC132269729 [Cornus florida]
MSSSGTPAKLTVKQKITYTFDKLIGRLCKSLAISGLLVFIIYIFLSNHPYFYSSTLLTKSRHRWVRYANPSTTNHPPTNISHLVFGISGSSNTWKNKRWYIESWWRPNMTRGYLFLDRPPAEFHPWPSSSPPFRVSEDTSRFKEYNKHPMPHAIRMVRVIAEIFKAENEGVRWYVMADDDTVLFINNLVEVLAKYDHGKYFYIGANSEYVASNFFHSFEMAFGGAGCALSYPLAEALAKNLDFCIRRYPTLYGSDHILQSCVADLGVTLTPEKGFHQIDLRGDISGLLSAHTQSPFLSLHHLDVVDPIFPSMNRYESVKHLMKAAEADESRLLQQTICYDKPKNWTFTISWGYSTQIYENIYPPSILNRPLETFRPWYRWARPPYMFNTRLPSKNPCEAPHVFFFESMGETEDSHIVTTYSRRRPRSLSACNSSSGNHSADYISQIRVLSPMSRHNLVRKSSNIYFFFIFLSISFPFAWSFLNHFM